VRIQELPGGKQHFRQPRQVRADIFEHDAEARHDVADQEQQHAAADEKQQRGIDRGADDLLTDLVDAPPVRDVASQRFADVTGLLARLHERDVQFREHLRRVRERLRQRLAFVEPAHEVVEHFAHLRVVFLFGEAFERVDQREAGVEQGRELLAEQHEREGLPARRERRRPALRPSQRHHAQAALFRESAGVGRIRRVERQRDDAGLAAHPLDVKAH